MPAMRLQGLDRLYFEHVGEPGRPLKVPPSVVSLLPEVMRPAGATHETRHNSEDTLETDVEVRDFPLPSLETPGVLTLRQIILNQETARVTDLWWALYDSGRRSDVWHFRADPMRTDNKSLSNYEIEAVSVAAGGGLELRVRGEMFRPQGAWSITGKIFIFSMSDGSLSFARVRNVFGFFHDYDLGGSSPATDVSTEREFNGGFEIRSYDSVGDKVLRACRFRDPLSDKNWKFDWAETEKSALCLSQKPGARSSRRGLDEPSFVEREGRFSR